VERKVEVFPMEADVKTDEGLIQKTVETRLVRLEGRVADIAADVGKATSTVRDLRGRVDDDSRAMRQEMRDGDRALREAGHERFLSLYKEMLDGDQALREVIYGGDRALREEMNEGLRSIRKDLWDRELRNMKIWAILITAAIFGAAAHGFHWI
jgi:hypothetical protein